MQNRNLYQMTAGAWLLSIMLSATLTTGLFLFKDQTFSNLSDLFHNNLSASDFGETAIIFTYLTVMHFICGIPILFLSYVGFSQLKKLKLKEFIVRPIMVTFSIILILGSLFSIFGSNISYLIKENFVFVMIFATTFILMTQEKLIKAIAANE